MDALLRELREEPDGIAEYYDTEISSKQLTIGSAADRNIQLLGRGIAPEHAMIVLAGSQLTLECRRGEVVRLNGKKRATAEAQRRRRDRARRPSPAHRSAAAGFQRGHRAAARTIASTPARSRARSAPICHRPGWASARMAWAGVVLVMLFGLMLPFFVMKLHHGGTATSSWIPGDKFWNSGPLHQVHQQAIGDRCETCHQKLFQRVQDAACTDCHSHDARSHHARAPGAHRA